MSYKKFVEGLAEQQGDALAELVEEIQATANDWTGREAPGAAVVRGFAEKARAALAATGKQQVGEVQGDGLAVLAQLAQVNRHCHSRFRDYNGPADCAVQAAIAALAARQPGEQVPVEFAVESKAFEAHAKRAGLNMGQHPLHYLFLDPKTYAARQAWKAALEFAPHAQGIDLGQFRPAVLAAIGFTGPNDHEREHLLGLLALIDNHNN